MSDRVHNIDVVRGLVMALMVIDHTRAYLSSPLLDPTDIAATTIPLFLTRWVTHFCAPVFVFLAGTSAFLQQKRRAWTTAETAKHLAVRGAWLIFVDIAIVRVLWWFNFDYGLTMGSVLFAIGGGMIALAACLRAGPYFLFAAGLGLVFGHNLVDGIEFAEGSPADFVWSILHVQTLLVLADGWYFVVGYPLIPWCGVVMLGYVAGHLTEMERSKRRRTYCRIGMECIFGFLLLRFLNFYGDPKPWTEFDAGWRTVLSFLNCAKYPPSLLYLLMTLGPMFLLLAASDSEIEPRWRAPISTLGRVPMFFYLTHLPLAHLAGIGLSLYRYGKADWWFRNPEFGLPDGYGWEIPVWYAVSASIVALLIPACYGYGRLKRTSKNPILRWI